MTMETAAPEAPLRGTDRNGAQRQCAAVAAASGIERWIAGEMPACAGTGVAAFGHAINADKDGAQTPWFGLHHAKLFRIRFRRILKHAARRDSGPAGQG